MFQGIVTGDIPRGDIPITGGDTPFFLVDRIRSVPGVSPPALRSVPAHLTEGEETV
jgi:hypothetical protein